MAMRGQNTNAEGYARSAAIVAATPFSECDAIAVLVGGNATIQLLDGSQPAFTGLVAGQILPLRSALVPAATATLAALYW